MTLFSGRGWLTGCLVLASIWSMNLSAQQSYGDFKYPLSSFGAPLAIQPPALSGSFGELRSNHFHSGLDFRTNQATGYPVYATADGYVSRLRVQNSGFGLALYIDHPNGFTSVYAHLSRFNPVLAKAVKDKQYKNKSYELDEFPQSGEFPVKKGDIIAYSGNTGSSGGPHLHFEIRDTKTEHTINPQRLGIQIPDQIPPVIQSLYVYRLNEKPFNEVTPKQYFQVVGGNGKFQLNKVNTIHLSGEVGFGIVVNDRHNGLSGNNGVYSIELKVDGNVVYHSQVERFSFDHSRAINSHVDFPALIQQKRSIQKSFVDPGNPLKIYPQLLHQGRLRFDDQQTHEVQYLISDAAGNQSSLRFFVKSDPKAVIPTPALPPGITFPFSQQNEFSNEEVKVILPKGTLYEELNFIYKKLAKPAVGAFSGMHQIHHSLIPLHKGFELWIKADSSLSKYQDKSLIVNSSRISQGGYYDQGYVKATPRSFGNFYIAIDTIPPQITPLNISEGKNMKDVSKINFRISDQLSGIKSFNGYLNGQWILMEFDAKTATLWHQFDERTPPGKNVFELVVTDMKDNVRKYQATFYR